jgi:hypothetical protein
MALIEVSIFQETTGAWNETQTWRGVVNPKLVVPLAALCIFVAGLLTLVSPFYWTGGVVGLFTGCEGGELREYFFGRALGKHIFEDIWSIVLGLGLMAGASVVGLTAGLALGIAASTSEKRSSTISSEPFVPPSETESARIKKL